MNRKARTQRLTNRVWKNLILVLVAFVIAPQLGYGQDSKTVLDGVSKAMGEVKSLQYSGSGAFFSFGQSFTPGEPWPRFGLKSYTRTIDYETPALRDEVVRAEAIRWRAAAGCQSPAASA